MWREEGCVDGLGDTDIFFFRPRGERHNLGGTVDVTVCRGCCMDVYRMWCFGGWSDGIEGPCMLAWVFIFFWFVRRVWCSGSGVL